MASGVVMVDLTDAPAFLLFSRTADTVPLNNIKALRRYARPRPQVTVVDWERFPDEVDEVLGTFVKHDDYPDRDVLGGAIALLARYPGLPFGLTWNNGIAVTADDYEHARQTWARWSRDPAAWTRLDPREDAVAPDRHFVPLLGENFARPG